LVVLTIALFTGCDPSLGGTEEPERYFTLQLLKLETDTVLYTFDLELSALNYGYATVIGDWSVALENTALTCANIIQRYEPTANPDDWEILGTEFYPAFVSRTIEFEGNKLPVNDLTMIELDLKDFKGAGIYTFDEDDLEGYFSTDHLDSNNTRYFCDSADGGYISITEYGEFGGVISGSAFLENAKLEYSSNHEEDLTFDIKATFSLKRDSDYVIKMRKLTYTFGGELNFTHESYKPVGRDTGLISRVEEEDGTYYEILGWSTEPDGAGTVYNLDNPLTMPDEDITLYAIFAED
jgi:hypothetical protein